MKIPNYINGEWKQGEGDGQQLVDPVTGEALVSVSSEGIDFAEALGFSRKYGTGGLQTLTYKQRADLLAKIADVLTKNRDEYFDICLRNMGATKGDAGFDVDGAIYTLKQYAKWGQALDGKLIKDGAVVPLSKTGAFQAQHFLQPLEGVAVFINAFNFPAWGLWEKAAPALLSGVAVLVKPATPTAWLTQVMVEDVIEAGILPSGALSIVCGSARDLLDHLGADDVVAFTGSASTAHKVRGNGSVIANAVRVNIEADSLNAAILGSDAPGTQPFDLLVKEVVREMTQKAGQKCTAIRRILAPKDNARAVADAIAAALAKVSVGNPRNPEVKCGPVVNKAQQKSVLEGIAELTREASVVFGDDKSFRPVEADAQKSCFVQPTLLFCEDAAKANAVNEVEVFGPVATVIPYAIPLHDNQNEFLSSALSPSAAIGLARRGGGSLVASIFSDDADFKRRVSLGIASTHGRIMVVDSGVNNQHTGHGNVMPNCLHGGPGRAGGGEELAGLRALELYHRRFVVQGPPDLLNKLSERAVELST